METMQWSKFQNFNFFVKMFGILYTSPLIFSILINFDRLY